MTARQQTSSITDPTLETVLQEWVATLDAIRDPIFVLDRDRRLVRVNKAFATLCGLPIHDLLTRSVDEVAPWLSIECGSPALQYQSGTERHGQLHTAANGRVFALRTFGMRSPAWHGVNILEDVTADIALEQAHQQTLARVTNVLIETVGATSAALHSKDAYTAAHGFRVARLAKLIAEDLGLGAVRVQGVYLGASIHDIGKMRVPAELLHRLEALTETERRMIRLHPETGVSILRGLSFPWPIHEIVMQHHERLDGSGYPAGLKGSKLCEEVRIVAVADVVEAMTAHRPYRPAMTMAAALEEITAGRGTRFDSTMVDACVALLESGRAQFLMTSDGYSWSDLDASWRRSIRHRPSATAAL